MNERVRRSTAPVVASCRQQVPQRLEMYLRQHNGQLEFECFVLPFGGKLDPENRWVVLSGLMPGQELEEEYAQTFSPTADAPAKSDHLSFGALYSKQRLGISDLISVPMAAFNLQVKRPVFSPISNLRISRELGMSIAHWKESLNRYIAQL